MKRLAAHGLFAIVGLAASVRLFAADPAPPRVERGDPSVDGSFLQPYTNRWRFSRSKPGGESVEMGIWTDHMERTTYKGLPAMRRTQVAEYKNGIRLTFVNVFDPHSMASLTFDYERSDTGEKRRLEIAGRRATFRRDPGKGDTAEQDYVAALGHDVLDFYDGLYGILIDTFPLKEGYAATFPAFDTDRASVDWVTLRVTGREQVEAGPGKTADTWVVHVETKTYGSSTWWLTREVPYVIRAALVLPENEGGATITYWMTG